ncbi:hypothetical protein A9P82_08520 [Arachidicoccus ginsenosidimutans]|nr:hypothetical protein A9P82_08520 [Arachidicoccus sp. BS20]
MLDDVVLNQCSKYSNIYELNAINPTYSNKKRKVNVSCTYDGFTIVSDVFKAFCEAEEYSGLEFITLPNSPGFYWFKINNVVEYDTVRRETRFINYSEECQGYEEIIGATPVCLKCNIPLANGFFRSDVCFGSYAGKSPIEMVGIETKQKLSAAGFKEIFFKEILDKYDWEK